jgi:hypothetical protein
MANNFARNPIVLDTFTSDIDVCSSMGFASGNPLKVNSIEWQTPTTVGDTAVITDGSGVTVFSETATVANQSVIKYFYGTWVRNLYIATSGVTHGKIIITLV